MQDVRERVFAERCHQNVNVVGHDDKFVETVAVTSEVKQCLFDQRLHFWISKVTGAVSLIEPMLKALREPLVVITSLFRRVRLRSSLELFVSFLGPLSQLFLRHGIGGAEREEIGNTVLTSVREVPGQIGDRFRGIKVADQSSSGVPPLFVGGRTGGNAAGRRFYFFRMGHSWGGILRGHSAFDKASQNRVRSRGLALSTRSGVGCRHEDRFAGGGRARSGVLGKSAISGRETGHAGAGGSGDDCGNAER